MKNMVPLTSITSMGPEMPLCVKWRRLEGGAVAASVKVRGQEVEGPS